jgi:DNA polymerase-1
LITFFVNVSVVSHSFTKTLEDARKTGLVTTISGRRRLLPDINSSNQQIRGFAERVAMNTPIQGSSADIIKAAMIRAHALLAEKNLKTKMLLQVHDELLFEVPLSEYKTVAPLMRDAMENAYTLRVPLLVDMKHGPNWNDMEAA